MRGEIDLDEDGYAAGLATGKLIQDTQTAIETNANDLYSAGRPETLAAYLDPSLIPLVEAILYPGLRQLGWDGRDYLNNR